LEEEQMKIFIEFSPYVRREYTISDKYTEALQQGDTVQINIKHPVLSEQLTACILTGKEDF
jgi:hypothetical protein